jgi:hypothetical protein
MLARQNPFLLLPRLPYDLGLLVDWIGQAQLYVLVKEDGLANLRALCVRDIFDLQIRLDDPQAQPQICGALRIDCKDAPALLLQLKGDPLIVRLQEVGTALAVPVA